MRGVQIDCSLQYSNLEAYGKHPTTLGCTPTVYWSRPDVTQPWGIPGGIITGAARWSPVGDVMTVFGLG